MTLHQPLYLLGLLPIGVLLWWCVVSLKDIEQQDRECKRLMADLEAAYPWLKDEAENGRKRRGV